MSQVYYNLVGEPKSDRIRIIASKIEDNPFNFAQSTLGPALSSRKYIGSGVQAGASACVAGFAVQFLGTVEEYEDMRLKYTWRDAHLFRDYLGAYDSDACDVERYANILLGLPSEWASSIYTTMWPTKWLDPLEEFIAMPTFTPQYKGEKEFSFDNFFFPQAKDAAFFLRRLADHFDNKTHVW